MNFTHQPGKIALFDPEQRLLAEVTFPAVSPDTVDINHTFVDPTLRGQGVADRLMKETVSMLQEKNKKAVLTCSYAVQWFAHHPEYSDLVKD